MNDVFKHLFDWKCWNGDIDCLTFHNIKLKIKIGDFTAGTQFDYANIYLHIGVLELCNDKSKEIHEFHLKLQIDTDRRQTMNDIKDSAIDGCVKLEPQILYENSAASCATTFTTISFPEEHKDNGKIKIVILQRGWVMIGRFYQEGTRCELHNSYVIRRWGTTKGLGQLALEGVTEETILDANHLTVDFHELTIVAALLCSEQAWGKFFAVEETTKKE